MEYNYKNCMKEDIREWIRCEGFEFTDDVDSDCEALSNEVWAEDCVTGNGPQGYDDEDKCLEYVKDNLRLALQVVAEFNIDLNKLVEERNPAQRMDCFIRCYLLDECVREVLDENQS